ncbi:hypothetical protein B0H15DRAFT_852239 [Mycena belliarum]|uniref:SWIM-type domain-containing protein n=1 Tax=Mycena belliarum TaxID=1033014 RepID=A0AAD6XRJ0_9AGAR|nr:hypothetical protein B0H15DRAFT_852239 [Mycena belliae]
MVLQKRQRDGGFEPWIPAGSPSNSTPTALSSRIQANDDADELPPKKKSRLSTVPLTPIPATPAKRKTPASPQIALSSSSQAHLESNSTPPDQKGRKKVVETAAVADSPPEKRGAMFKKRCPQNILDRVDRVMTQRFFMVDRNRFEGELKEEFQVLGSTGNIYTVTIEHKPSCNCPDAQKGNHCKHILFIFLKVLQVAYTSGFWYQKALLTSELTTMFENAPLAPNALAHPRIREAYARATGKTTSTPGPSPPEAAGPKKRLPGADDDCPICYDAMHGVAERALAFCEQCGNAVHAECFAQWKQTAAKKGGQLTCIYCRAIWPAAAAGGANGSGIGARTTAGGYLNISGVAGPQRDTTTYYHGPRRGRRSYGYNPYGDD